LTELEQYAEQLRARRSAAGNDSWICEPLLDCTVLGEVKAIALLNWMHFNPFGPTNSWLFFVPLPESDEGLLSFYADNPFSTDRAVFAVIPERIAAEHLGEITAELFAANGHETCPLLPALPTSIAHSGNWDLSSVPPFFDEVQTRILFKVAARRNAHLNSLRSTVEFLRQYPTEPWQRTAAELDDALLRRLITNDAPTEAYDENLFNEWFDLVTNADHVRSERENFETAWQGAITNVSKKRG